MTDAVEKARELGWPDKLINELLKYDEKLFYELVEDKYKVRVVSPDEVFEVKIYLGGWWKLIFGDIDIVEYTPSNVGKGPLPSAIYKLRLHENSLLQYYVELKHPLLTVSERKLFYAIG